MANWAVGKMNIRGSFEDMNKFVQENFIDNIIIENKIIINKATALNKHI